MPAPGSVPRAELERTFSAADWVLLCVPALIWGSSFLFMAIGLDAFAPGVIPWLRVAFGFAALAVVPRARSPIDRADRGRVALLGITWMAFPFTMFPIAQQWIDSSVAGMLNSAMPLATIVFGWTLFRVPTGARQLAGVAVGLVGIVCIGVPTARIDGTSALGVALVLAAVSSYGVAINLAVPLQQRYGSLPVLLRALGVAVVCTTPFALADVSASVWAWDAFAACVALGVAGTGVAYVVAATLAGRVGAVRTSIVTYLIPVVSIVLGVAFRGESVTAWAVVGTLIVIAGAWLTTTT